MRIYDSLSFFRAAIGYAILTLFLLTLTVSLMGIAPGLMNFLLKFWPVELLLIIAHTVLLFCEDYRNNREFFLQV